MKGFPTLVQEYSKASTGLSKITTLPNGIRVASENTPGHFSAVGVYVDAGSRYETAATRGVSHILDRLAFKVKSKHVFETCHVYLTWSYMYQ